MRRKNQLCERCAPSELSLYYTNYNNNGLGELIFPEMVQQNLEILVCRPTKTWERLFLFRFELPNLSQKPGKEGRMDYLSILLPPVPYCKCFCQ